MLLLEYRIKATKTKNKITFTHTQYIATDHFNETDC